MGSCCPSSECRAGRDVGRDPRESLRELVTVARALGSPVVRTFFGGPKDRFIRSPSLAERRKAAVAVLRDVKSAAEDHGVTIAMENHLAETSTELLEMVEGADSPFVAVCFDTANSLLMLEDPLDACRNLLPFIRTTHLKDGVLCLDGKEGARYVGAVPGQGSCRIREILLTLSRAHPDLPLNVEDHWETFRVPLLDEDFISKLPHLSAESLPCVFRWIIDGERALKEGRVPSPSQLEGEGRWEIIRERFPRCMAAARALLAEVEGKEGR
jgi:sugar phosphate isomerase/epimerase